MTFKTDDRVFETSITTGTGTYTLDGAQVGFTIFAGMGANNDCPYFATDDTNWEVGIGTVLTGPNRLQRTTILRSSNADAAVNWAAGTRKIRCGLPAAMALPRLLSKSVAGGANVALTTDEQRRRILVFTGVLTGNINVTVDATPWDWLVYNNTSGAFSLTFKTTAGTGVAITQGTRTALECDGTNVVSAVTGVAAFNASGAVTLQSTLAAGGTITLAASQTIDLAGSSGANYGRLSYNSSGNTVLNVDNAYDSDTAEIRLRTKTLGSVANVALLNATSATFPGSISGSTVIGAMIAAQNDQESATAVNQIVTPGRQQFHPSAAKAWINCNAAGAIAASYNVTGITDTGTGLLSVTWNVDFSSANYAVMATAVSGSQYFVSANTLAAGSCAFICWTSTTAALADPTSYCIVAFGDQ